MIGCEAVGVRVPKNHEDRSEAAQARSAAAEETALVAAKTFEELGYVVSQADANISHCMGENTGTSLDDPRRQAAECQNDAAEAEATRTADDRDAADAAQARRAAAEEEAALVAAEAAVDMEEEHVVEVDMGSEAEEEWGPTVIFKEADADMTDGMGEDAGTSLSILEAYVAAKMAADLREEEEAAAARAKAEADAARLAAEREKARIADMLARVQAEAELVKAKAEAERQAMAEAQQAIAAEKAAADKARAEADAMRNAAEREAARLKDELAKAEPDAVRLAKKLRKLEQVARPYRHYGLERVSPVPQALTMIAPR